MLLLDTDVMVDILRGHAPALAWLESVQDEAIVLPGFVAMELIQGCTNQRDLRAIEEELQKYEIAWPVPSACDRALRTYAQFHLSHGVGLLDVLIGQLAIELGASLHTFNDKHYRPIPELELVQP